MQSLSDSPASILELCGGLALGIGLMATLLFATPASAKATTEFIVSGDNLPRPVFVSADEVATVEGWVMGGEAEARPERLGSKYDLDVLQFQVNSEGPPMRSVLARWMYYPEAEGALTADGDWIPFSPKLNGLVAARISDQHPLKARTTPFSCPS